MLEKSNHQSAELGVGSELSEALQLISRLIVDGVSHGHFEISVTCETAKMGRRLMIVRAGKNHKFSIEKSEIPQL